MTAEINELLQELLGEGRWRLGCQKYGNLKSRFIKSSCGDGARGADLPPRLSCEQGKTCRYTSS